jgi:hypothetical protein
MSLRHWGSLLERRHCIAWISFASALLDERDVLLLEQQDNSSTEDSSNDDSNCSTSTDASSDGFSAIDDALQWAAAIFSDLEGSLEDLTIKQRQNHDGLLIKDVSDDDAIAHFRFRKAHLQELADSLWPRLHGFLGSAVQCSRRCLIIFENQLHVRHCFS